MKIGLSKTGPHKAFVFSHKEFSQHLMFFIGMLLIPGQPISSHGTVTSPPSRIWICYQELIANGDIEPSSAACISAFYSHPKQAFYDWNEIARMDADGNHRDIIMDGNLASAGRPEKYGGMDQVRNDWVATPVSPGPFSLTWSITAPHATLYYEVYITKEGWTPNQPLTWDSLELLIRTGERPLSEEDKIEVTLPSRTGKHVLYSIWQRSLSPEAFYSTSDVDFGTTLSTDEFKKEHGSLQQNSPNPFTRQSTIKYHLHKSSKVEIKVYNISGQEVSILVDNVKSAGEHEVIFNAENIHDSGVYFYVFRTENYTETRRMVIQK